MATPKKISGLPRKRKWRDLVPPADKEANPLYITEHMNAQRISDAMLAEAFSVRRETAFRWRTDQNRLSVKEAIDIADFLGTSLDGLRRRPDDRAPPEEISFDSAGRHITDKEARQRIVKIIEDMRGSR